MQNSALMELVTKKSECKVLSKGELIKSPKEAMRKTLKNTLVRNGLVVKLFPATVMSSNGKHDIGLWG